MRIFFFDPETFEIFEVDFDEIREVVEGGLRIQIAESPENLDSYGMDIFDDDDDDNESLRDLFGNEPDCSQYLY